MRRRVGDTSVRFNPSVAESSRIVEQEGSGPTPAPKGFSFRTSSISSPEHSSWEPRCSRSARERSSWEHSLAHSSGAQAGAQLRSTARGTGRSAAAGSDVAALGRGSAAARAHSLSRVAASRRGAAARGLLMETVEQSRFSVHGAKATNHHSGRQGDPFHISASPRKD